MKRPTTLLDIASTVGVSKAAVSAVLSGSSGTIRVADDTADRIRRVAGELGYRPHAAARAMARRLNHTVGVLLPNQIGDPLTHPIGFETLMGVADGLQARGLTLCLARTGVHDVSNPRMLQERSLDTLLVLHHVDSEVAEAAARLTPHAIFVDAPVWRPIGCLRRDERLAGRLAAEAMRGYGPAVCVVGPRSLTGFAIAGRLDGVRSVLPDAICHPEPDLDQPAPAWLRRGVALIALSVYQAQVVRAWCEILCLRPGRDLAIACCDDSAQLNRHWPDLARARFDRYAFGFTAAGMAADAVAGVATPSRLVTTSWHDGATARMT